MKNQSQLNFEFQRRIKPIKNSKELASIVKKAKRKNISYKKNPATKTFQAIRIFVNKELTELILGLKAATKLLLINQLKAIINVINEEKIEEIKKIRDKAIILVGFGGGFRRTELTSIDHEDLEFVTEGVKITIKRSKTDQFGEDE